MSTSNRADSKPMPVENPKFFDTADSRNTTTFAPTRTGMSGHYDELRLTDAEHAKIIVKSPE